MCILPQLHQIVEMRLSYPHNMAHLVSFCILRQDCVVSISQPDAPIGSQFEDDNSPLLSVVNVRRIVIFRAHGK